MSKGLQILSLSTISWIKTMESVIQYKTVPT